MAEPLPICYLNGEFLPFEAARISPFDRGFLFGDGVYEVMPVYGGRPFRLRRARARLTASLAAIHMEDPHSAARMARAPRRAHREERRRRPGALLAGHPWRGTRPQSRAAARDSRARCLPSARRCVLPRAGVREHGIACISAADTRWARCDIKSTALLANVLLRELVGGGRTPRRRSCCATAI